MQRILIHSQHLGGSGHFVRTFEIASALAQRHEVHLIDSGRPVPRPEPAAPFHLLELPRIQRAPGGGIAPLDPSRELEPLMVERRRILQDAITRIKPDVFFIEHFPFSKGMLADEILPIIDVGRKVNSRMKAVCSIRDLCPVSRHDPPNEPHAKAVVRILHSHFDLLLVHGDPAVARLEDQLPWSRGIRLPTHYTGYVSQRPVESRAENGHPSTVMVSTGGTGFPKLTSCAVEAWKLLHTRQAMAQHRLVLFQAINGTKNGLINLSGLPAEADIQIRPFSTDFLQWMQAADLSISPAGYNTCTNIIQTRKRAILVPNTDMIDQMPRMRRLVELGLATAINPEELTPARLAEAITTRLSQPAPQHNIDLDGAQKTLRILESLH